LTGWGVRRNQSVSYSSDVFLSYRRANAWPKFVGSIFKPMFDHWLSAELGRTAKVFFDIDDIETGAAWPQKLAHGVASSKLMVCLWSMEYFGSEWCKAELSHMLARREAAARRGDPPPLVVAVVIHGKRFPDELSDIQQFPIQKYANPWLARGSQNEQELSEKIKLLALHVAHALEQVPEYDASWRDLAVQSFESIFRRDVATQRQPPSLGGGQAK
jgi:hypothetical protein